MRVLIAPDSFGGTLTAPQASEAIAAGWARARPQDSLRTRPLSDGGEGLLEALGDHPSQFRKALVRDPLGRLCNADWTMGVDAVAVVEAAEACGLKRVGPNERAPMRATTYGVGELLLAAEAEGASKIIVGLGGSATVDGGAGALARLGYLLLDINGRPLPPDPFSLAQVRSVIPPDEPLIRAEVEAWLDVRTTLQQAASLFGPQKGLSAQDILRAEKGLQRWADCLEEATGSAWRDCIGSGAAGGLGFGLASIGARLVNGAEAFAHRVAVAQEVNNAHLVITGEGRLDETSLEGKVISGIVATARRNGIPVMAVVGRSQIESSKADLMCLVEASPDGPGDDPESDVRHAAERLAASLDRWEGGRFKR